MKFNLNRLHDPGKRPSNIAYTLNFIRWLGNEWYSRDNIKLKTFDIIDTAIVADVDIFCWCFYKFFDQKFHISINWINLILCKISESLTLFLLLLLLLLLLLCSRFSSNVLFFHFDYLYTFVNVATTHYRKWKQVLSPVAHSLIVQLSFLLFPLASAFG